MLNLAVTSTLIAGASAVALSKGASALLTPGHSEPGSLVFFGLGLFVVSLVVRRTRLNNRID